MVSHHLKLIKLARQADLESPINLDLSLGEEIRGTNADVGRTMQTPHRKTLV